MIRALLSWLFHPRCPWCGQHTPHLEAHYAIDHAGLPEQP